MGVSMKATYLGLFCYYRKNMNACRRINDNMKVKYQIVENMILPNSYKFCKATGLLLFNSTGHNISGMLRFVKVFTLFCV